MKSNELVEIVKTHMIADIQDVLTGVKSSAQLYCVKPADIMNYIESIGGKVDEDSFETNGYQWDFWFDVEYKGKRYGAAGDGYYCDSVGFQLREDVENDDISKENE